MPTIEFPYSIYKKYRLPLVPINVKGCDNWKLIWAYVDSGATYSIFNYKESRRLGIDLKDKKKIYIKVGDGSYISTYLVNLPVKVEHLEFNAVIGFSEELGTGFNIIGRKDFFERFVVCFDERRGIVQFHHS